LFPLALSLIDRLWCSGRAAAWTTAQDPFGLAPFAMVPQAVSLDKYFRQA
jgi:hypothetical protein